MSRPGPEVESVYTQPEVVSERVHHEEPVLHEEPVRHDEQEAYDIEPAYQDASRNLTTSRWDPIPTLRPSDNGWRDRSVQPPVATDYGIEDRRRWPREEDANANSFNRWIPEEAPKTEPLPEPLLSRQWGLLSKFQQARNSSGEREAAKVKIENEPLREPANGDERQS